MGELFEKYGNMIIGIIVAVCLIAVVIVIGGQFKTGSSSQFGGLEDIAQEKMTEIEEASN